MPGIASSMPLTDGEIRFFVVSTADRTRRPFAGADNQRLRQHQVEGFRGLHVDHQFQLGGLHNWNFASLHTAQDPVDEHSGVSMARGFTYLGWVNTRPRSKDGQAILPHLIRLACRLAECPRHHTPGTRHADEAWDGGRAAATWKAASPCQLSAIVSDSPCQLQSQARASEA